MNITLWIIQTLLALMFFMAGAMKIFKPQKELSAKLGDWVDQFSENNIKLIGLLEVLGSIGILLPMAINVMPIFNPLAAIGLALTMGGAIKVHYERKETNKIISNLVLMSLALFVAVGRLCLVPII